MNLTRVLPACAVTAATLLALNVAAARSDECDVSPLVGTWTFTVSPQPNPDVPVIPPPFSALFEFETSGTFTETDTAFHPTGAVELFPDLGPLSSSDGWGAWKADGGNRYHGRFIKNLFTTSGAPVGFLITHITITLRGRDRLEARTDSDFVLGDDLEAAPFFTGGVALVTGTRLRAD
jgi:hypothetical protein